MLDALIKLIGCLFALGLAAFVIALAIGLVSVFATAIRSGSSSQVRRLNFNWFRRLHRVFWAMYGTVLLYAVLNGFRSR